MKQIARKNVYKNGPSNATKNGTNWGNSKKWIFFNNMKSARPLVLLVGMGMEEIQKKKSRKKAQSRFKRSLVWLYSRFVIHFRLKPLKPNSRRTGLNI
jgi:hypothetical protein